MKHSFLVLVALATASILTPAALADPIVGNYEFAFIGSGTVDVYPNQTPIFIDVRGWLIIDTTPVAPVPPGKDSVVTSGTPAAYQVVDGGMTFDGDSFNLIPIGDPGYYSKYPVPGGTCCGVIYDDLLYPELGDGYYLNSGLLFTDANGDVIELWTNPGLANDEFAEWISKNDDIYAQGAFLLAPSPEPSSWLLFGTGLLCVVAISYRKASRHALRRIEIGIAGGDCLGGAKSIFPHHPGLSIGHLHRVIEG